MTINIQNCANVNVLGHHNSRNCKAVYNITTGKAYASVLDAAHALGVTQGAVSFALDPNHKRRCKGMRLCFIAHYMEHLDEINEANDARAKKSDEDRAAANEYAKLRKAQEDYAEHKSNAEKYRRMMEEELRLMKEAERILKGE